MAFPLHRAVLGRDVHLLSHAQSSCYSFRFLAPLCPQGEGFHVGAYYFLVFTLSLLCLYFGGKFLIQNPHRLIHHLLYHLPATLHLRHCSANLTSRNEIVVHHLGSTYVVLKAGAHYDRQWKE